MSREVQALVTVQEYLTTAYHPDREYVDGVVVERNGGQLDHSRAQTELSCYVHRHAEAWSVWVYIGQRMQLKPTRFRVPDVSIVAGAEPDEQIFTAPPLAAIEILSKDDRWSDVQEKVEDYLAFGIPYVWIIEPRTRKAYQCDAQGMHEVFELRSERPEFVVPLNAVFRQKA